MLKNRVVMAPMTTEASQADGTVSSEELGYLRRRAAGGVAAVITSCAYVDDRGKAFRGMGAAHDAHTASLAKAAGAIRGNDARAILQLYDAGRLASPAYVGDTTLRAPSPVASSRPGARLPRAMSEGEVADIIERFAAASLRARAAGFDGVELHGANHYLLHQFFSPRSNRRNDRWGGSIEARMAFPLAVVGAIRRAVGSGFAVGYRVTPFETEATSGITLADTLRLVAALRELGVDYVHVSLDNYVAAMPLREDRQPVEARVAAGSDHPVREIARVAGTALPVMAVGGVSTVADAERMLADGAAAVALGRALLVDPAWPDKMRQGLAEAVRRAASRSPEWIATELDIPPRMVAYVLSRPGLIALE